ncbi:hypothetical protein RZO55_17435 [Clostridium boliviensis]|uniref:Uncharacterized protein n=1 Tax=Clostridium boliviensis TaxID=318465 RepID=A0ABU4GP06_9CLOT|nr:hypothetical protein [Clostridium boliviensis]MDW2799360.1 hypothetical protein [Clostridium boliviensis]
MKNETKNCKFSKPGEDDFYDINEYNRTLDSIDEELMNLEEKKLDKTGDSSQTVTVFDEEVLRENLESGENLSLTHGKIKKWFSEMKDIAFSGRASDIETDGANRFVSDGEKKNWNLKVSADGNISDTKIQSLDSVSTEFPVPEGGETSRQFFGKVRKFIQDFNNFKTGIITVGKLVNNGSTTAEGYALDARYGKTLFDLYNKLNEDLDSMKFYTTPEQLGLTNPSSIIDVVSAMADNSLLYISVADNTPQYQTLCPKYWGLLEIIKINIYRVSLKFTDINDIDINNVYQAIYHKDNGFSGWKRITVNSDLALQILDTKTVLTLKNNFEFWFDNNFGILSRCGKNVHLNMLLKGKKGIKHSVICTLPFTPIKSEIHSTTLADGTYVEVRTLNDGTLFYESATIPTIDWWPIDITYTCK